MPRNARLNLDAQNMIGGNAHPFCNRGTRASDLLSELCRATGASDDLFDVHSDIVGPSDVSCQAFVGSPDPTIPIVCDNGEMEDTVGSRLRRLRHKLKKRQWQVADAIGISRNFLSGIENDSEPYGRMTLIKLSEYYGVTIDELELGAEPTPSQAEIIKEPSEIALLRSWRKLTIDQRELLATFIDRADDSKKSR